MMKAIRGFITYLVYLFTPWDKQIRETRWHGGDVHE